MHPQPNLDGRNCPIAKTAKKSGFRYLTLFPQKTPKWLKSVLGVGNPTTIRLKTPILVPFWKLALAHLEDIMGEKGHLQPSQGHFGDSTKGVFVKTTSNSWPLWHFPRPDPLSKAITTGPARLSFGFRLPNGVEYAFLLQVVHRVSGSR